MRRRRLLLVSLLIFTTLLSLAAFQYRLLLTGLGKYLITELPLEKADAIAVLNGSSPDRIMEAAKLYHAGYAPQIILTRGEEPPGYRELLSLGVRFPESHELNLDIALRLGVPASAVRVLDERAKGTRTELIALYNFASKRGIRSVIMVTSKYHTRRATKIFRWTANGRLKVITRPSRYDPFDPKRWWRDRVQAGWVLSEYGKLAFFHLENLRRSAKPGHDPK